VQWRAVRSFPLPSLALSYFHPTAHPPHCPPGLILYVDLHHVRAKLKLVGVRGGVLRRRGPADQAKWRGVQPQLPQPRGALLQLADARGGSNAGLLGRVPVERGPVRCVAGSVAG
jgi:hypothetical protein